MKLIIFSLVFLAILSCEFFQEDEYYYLPDHSKTSYIEKDTIIFQNQFGIEDSFLIDKIIKGLKYYSLTGSSSKAPFAYFEFEKIGISRLHDSIMDFRCNILLNENRTEFLEALDNCDKWIEITIGSKDVNRTKERSLIPVIRWYGGIMQNDTLFEEFNMDYKVIEDIYSFTLENNGENYFKIKEVYYHYKLGIIKYVDIEGIDWVLIKR